MSSVIDSISEIPLACAYRKPLPEYRLVGARRKFGLYFYQIRTQKGFKRQLDLEERTGVSHHTIGSIERGHMIMSATVSVLRIFAEAFSCELYFEDAEPGEQFDDHCILNEILRRGAMPRFIDRVKEAGE